MIKWIYVWFFIYLALEQSISKFNGIFYLYVKFSNALGNFIFSVLLDIFDKAETAFIIMSCLTVIALMLFLLLPKIEPPANIKNKKTVTIRQVYDIMVKTKPLLFLLIPCFHVGISYISIYI